MLFRNRVDVAVSDLNIFSWYAHQLSAQEKIDLGQIRADTSSVPTIREDGDLLGSRYLQGFQ